MKVLLFSALVSISLAQAATAFEEAEAAFQQGLYQEALSRFEKIPGDAAGTDRFRIFHRTQEARALLFRFGEAAQALFDAPLPQEPIEQAQFRLLRAEIGRSYLKQYSRNLPADRTQDASDVTKWPLSQWKEKIGEDYFALWPMRSILIKAPLAEQAFFIQTKDTDVVLLPTLWDFAVSRWTQELTPEAEAGNPPSAVALLEKGFSPRVSPDTPAADLALSLWEDASRDKSELRALAVEHWRLQRIFPPWGYPESSDKAGIEKLAKALEKLSTEFGQGRTKATAASQAARLYADLENYAEAVRLCRAVESAHPTDACTQLRVEIETPRLEVQTRPTPTTADERVTIRARNLGEVYLRLYPTTLAVLEKHAPRANAGEWAELRQLSAGASAYFLKRNSTHSGTLALKPIQEFDWVEADAGLPPALPTGLYAVLVSDEKTFGPGARFLRAAVMNVTDTFLFADRIHDAAKGRHRLSMRLLEGAKGEPVKGASIRIKDKGGKRRTLRTDASGSASALPVGNLIDPLAISGTSHAYLPSGIWMSTGGQISTLLLQIDSDRPIYRPGQQVQVRVTALHKEGDAYSPARDPEATFTATDANGKEIFRSPLKFNAFGSAALHFRLPEKGLLGVFSLQASGKEVGTNTQGSAWAQIRVEEYLRPDFEVLLADPPSTWKYGSAAKVQGSARTYFGAAVVNAPVTYRVYREPYFPPFWHFYPFQGAATGRSQVAQGAVRTDRQGAFSFAVPLDSPAGKDPAPSRYTVEVDVTGTSGRTLSESRSYQASKQAFAWEITPSENYFTQGGHFLIRAVSLENLSIDAHARASIYALEGPIPDGGTQYSATQFASTLDALKTGSRVHTGKLRTAKAGAKIKIPKLPPGIYRLKIDGADSDGMPVEAKQDFLVWGKTLALPAVALPLKPEFSVGQNAKALIGSSELKGKMIVEVWRGEKRLSSEFVPAGLRLHSLPILASFRGGITLRWYGVSNYRLRSGDLRLKVPWDDRKLTLKLTTGPKPKPGAKVTWNLELRDPKGKPVEAEALLRVIDRSLEAYAKLPPPWVESLYGESFETPASKTSSAPTLFSWLIDRPEAPKTASVPKIPSPPHLRSAPTRFSYGVPLGSGGKMRTLAPQLADTTLMAETRHGPQDAEPKPGAIRREFQETAYFGPQILIRDGKASVNFAFSDAATDWSVSGFALDPQQRWAAIETRVTTARAFMVEALPPRFAREKDSVDLQVLVHNHSEARLAGSASLHLVFENAGTGKQERRAFKARTFRLAPGASQALSWPVVIPEGSGEISVRAQGTAGNLFDASVRKMSWLPSRYRFANSSVIAFESKGTHGSKSAMTLKVAQPADAKVESAVLQIDPQLTGAIVSALPQLVEPERGDVVSVVNRLIPLALTHQLFKDTPELKTLLTKVPKLETQTAPWEKEDPRRRVLLEETPWWFASQGGRKASFDLRNAEEVERLAQKTWTSLEGLQNPGGAFAWFPGGRDDAYLTVYVLGMLAEAKRHGVEVPQAIPAKALPFLKKSLSLWLQPETESLSNAVLAGAMVSTLYPASDWEEWLKSLAVYVDRHRDTLTPLGKAYVADIAFRVGDKTRGEAFLSSALDGARENETGTFWAPEKQSWNWYQDTLDQHALFLKLLAEWKPDDKRLDGMVRWLLFQRKASQWRSPRSAASAILALLQYQRKRGSLFAPEHFQWEWDGKKQTVALSGKEFLDLPLRWLQNNPTSQSLKATVTKQGGNSAFASLTAVFIGGDAPASSSGPLSLQTHYFTRTPDRSGEFRLQPLVPGQKIAVGTQIEVQCTLNASAKMEYLHLRLPRAAGLEPADLLSEWHDSAPVFFREVRDSTDSFFLPKLPAGEVVLRARYFATTAGDFRFGPATAQALYAPDLTATAPGMPLRITPAP